MLGVIFTVLILLIAVGAVTLAVIMGIKNRGRCGCCKDGCAGCSQNEGCRKHDN